MQSLEVSGTVRPIYGSLGVKGLIHNVMTYVKKKTVNIKYACHLTEDSNVI